MRRHKVKVKWVGDDVFEWIWEERIKKDKFDVGEVVSATWPENSRLCYEAKILIIVELEDNEDVSPDGRFIYYFNTDGSRAGSRPLPSSKSASSISSPIPNGSKVPVPSSDRRSVPPPPDKRRRCSRENSAPPTTSSSQSGPASVQSLFDKLTGLISENFRATNDKLENLGEKIDSVATRVTALEEKFEALPHTVPSPAPPVAPPPPTNSPRLFHHQSSSRGPFRQTPDHQRASRFHRKECHCTGGGLYP